MDVSKLRNFKTPLPVKSEVEVEVVEARDLTGNKEDEAGDKSEGLGFKYRIVGPENAILNDEDRSSALGFEFDENFWFPRKSLRQKNPQVANRMDRDFARQLEAAFGKEFPDDVTPNDWKGKHLILKISSKYDDYNKDDIVVVQERKAL